MLDPHDQAAGSDNDWKWQAEVTIPSEPGAGKRILQQVLDQLEIYEYSPRDIFDVHMALEEALVNAIKHGNGLDASKQVRVLCKLSPDRLRVEIEDEGPGFNPDDVPDCTAVENLEKASGRGIMLMRSFMSSVNYNDTGNRVVMEKERAERAG